jgi:hypothetical protein
MLDKADLSRRFDMEAECMFPLSDQVSFAIRNGPTARESSNFERIAMCNEDCSWRLTEATFLYHALWAWIFIQFSGGVDNTGFLQLTEAVNEQSSSFLLNTPAGVAPINDFTATWMMRVGGGTATPADGFSFVLGPDIADGTFGEDGAGSGLIVSFDTYDNGTTEVAPEIAIRYKLTDVATRPFDISVMRTDGGTTPVFKQIGVRVNRNGTLDLYYGDTAVYRGLPLPNYTPFVAGRFGWGARTGGLNDNHWVDSIKIALNTQPVVTAPTIGYSLSGGNIVLTWQGGGTLQSTTGLP